MNRNELEHAIRAACDVADDDELWVFGSQAVLGQFPDAPESLRRSIEVDVCPRHHPDRVDDIDGALGELSPFYGTFGFYVHGVPIDSAVLPVGWEERAIPVSGKGERQSTGLCLEAHDLAASKLVAMREKDRTFVRTLLAERLVKPDILLDRLKSLDVEEELQDSLTRWVSTISSEL